MKLISQITTTLTIMIFLIALTVNIPFSNAFIKQYYIREPEAKINFIKQFYRRVSKEILSWRFERARKKIFAKKIEEMEGKVFVWKRDRKELIEVQKKADYELMKGKTGYKYKEDYIVNKLGKKIKHGEDQLQNWYKTYKE